jgi:hypothetical protein
VQSPKIFLFLHFWTFHSSFWNIQWNYNREVMAYNEDFLIVTKPLEPLDS